MRRGKQPSPLPSPRGRGGLWSQPFGERLPTLCVADGFMEQMERNDDRRDDLIFFERMVLYERNKN